MLLWKARLGMRFVLAAVGIATVSMLIVGTIGFLLGRRGIETHTDLHLQSVVALESDKLVGWLQFQRSLAAGGIYPRGNTQIVDTLLREEMGSRAHDDASEQLSGSFRQVGSRYPTVQEIVLLDSQGHIRYSSDPELRGLAGATDRMLREGSKGFYVGLTWEMPANAESPLLVIAEPARGDVSGVVVAYLDPTPLQALLEPDPAMGERGRLYLAQLGEGLVTTGKIVQNPTDGYLSALEGVKSGANSRFTSMDGLEMVGQSSQVGNLPWKLVAGIPIDDAFADVGEMSRLITLALALIGAAAALVAWRLSVTITGPLKEAVSGAQEIGKGNLDYRIPVRSEDEIGELAASFNQMAANLTAVRSDLFQAERRIAYQEISERVLRAVPISIAALDEDGGIVAANRQFCDTFSVVPEECEGRRLSDIVDLGTLEREVSRAVKSGTAFRGQWVWQRRDGVRRQFYASVNPMSVDQDEPHYVLLALEDITERLAAEWRYQVLMENTNDGVLVIDAETGQIQEANSRAAEMLGEPSRQDLAGRDVLTVHPEAVRELARARFMNILELGSAVFEDLPLAREDGTELQVQVSARLVDLGGEKLVQSVVSDITERKEAERALRESEEKFRAILHTAVDGIVTADERGAIEALNPAAERMFGYTANEIAGQNISILMPSPDRERHDAYIARYLDTGEARIIGSVREMIGQRSDGTVFPIDLTVSDAGLGQRRVFAAIIRDITQRKDAEQAQARFEAILEATPDFVSMADAEGRTLYVNRAGRRMVGLGNDEDVSGLLISDFHPEWAYEQLEREGLPAAVRDLVWTGETALRNREGREVPASMVLLSHKTAEGEVEFFSTISRDLTERIQAENALHQSETRFRELYDEAPVGYCELDPEGYITRINKTQLEMLGYAEEEMCGQPVWEFAADEECRQTIRARISSAAPSGAFECDYRRKDGSTLTILIEERLIENEGGRTIGIRCTFQDITERKRAEQRLREASRLASVGELAAGVAHEINNPLTSILGFSELLMDESLPEQARRDVERIGSDAQRAARVVQNLLSFARRREPEKRCLSVIPLIEKALELRAYELKVNSIKVTTHLAYDIPHSLIDEHQLIQVLLNVLVNAEQAMSEAGGGGQITIGTGVLGDRIVISVSDDGPGVTPENLSKLFDPFYTTKEVGKGTGLGLSLSYGIVQQHGGDMWAENNPGGGMTFHIELPVVGPEGHEDVHDDSHHEDGEGPAIAVKHVLVVDDEPSNRDLIARQLSDEGYDVDLAATGEEAWGKIQNRRYDRILLDLKMPGMGGRQLYVLVNKWDSDLARRIIFVTGDTLSETTHAFLAATGNPLLSKPFHREQLREVISSQLEAPNE